MQNKSGNSIGTGFLLIDKPSAMTSHDVVDVLRKKIGIKKIGHAGTLDPLATGLMIVAVGRQATRAIDDFVKLDKEYEAVFILGTVSDTHDQDGKLEEKAVKDPGFSSEAIGEFLISFRGEIEQVPPMFSAKKIGGRKLYELARQGKTVERQPSRVRIDELRILDYKWPKLKVFIACSSGTYVRSLARDLGRLLKVGAYVGELRRTKIGPYAVKAAYKLDEIDAGNFESLFFALPPVTAADQA